MTKDLINTNQDLSLPSYDLDGILPDLNNAEALPIDLVEGYWTPEAPGETKRVFFKKIIEKDTMLEDDTTKKLTVAQFLECCPDGTYRLIGNATVRLVQHMRDMQIEPGTPLQITYTGKTTTRSGYKIDTWQIRPLQIPGHDSKKLK